MIDAFKPFIVRTWSNFLGRDTIAVFVPNSRVLSGVRRDILCLLSLFHHLWYLCGFWGSREAHSFDLDLVFTDGYLPIVNLFIFCPDDFVNIDVYDLALVVEVPIIVFKFY